VNNEAFKKGQRLCCFGGKSGMSKEHFWPEWAAPLLPEGSDHIRLRMTDSGASIPSVDHPLERQGAPKTIKLNVVCKTCNSGWMGALEEEVRPWLEPMIKSEKVELGKDAQRTLAEYFMMKTFVADQSIAEWIAFTQAERTSFYESKTISPCVHISVLQYRPEPSFEVAQYNKERPKEQNLLVNRMFTPTNFTFRFGTLFVQVLLARKAKGQLLYNRRVGATLFPPQPHTVHWPPVGKLSDVSAYAIQHTLALVQPHGDTLPFNPFG
jgi:hypothetical protein